MRLTPSQRACSARRARARSRAAPRPARGPRRRASCGAAPPHPGSSNASASGPRSGSVSTSSSRPTPRSVGAAHHARRRARAPPGTARPSPPATRPGRWPTTSAVSAAACMRASIELGGREQAGHRARARAGAGRARRTAAPCPPAGRGCTRAAGPSAWPASPVSSPIRRPALPRASSAMSGFFFCGSIDEPVLYASARRRNPNSSRRPQHDLLAEPREVHLTQRRDEQRLGDEVAVRHRVERVVEARGRTRASVATLSGSSGRLEPASAPAPSGDTSARAKRVAPPVDVARERPEVREEVMGEQHRLGALQMRVTGERCVARRRPRGRAARSAARGPDARRRAPRAARTTAARSRPGRCGSGRCAASRPHRPRAR